MRFTFSKQEILHYDREFKRVFKNGKVLRSSGIIMFAYQRASEDEQEIKNIRIGIAISRRSGIAVIRNRLKRRIREIFRLNKHLLKQNFDIVFLIKEKLPAMNFEELKNTVFLMWKKSDLFEIRPEA